VSLFLIGMRGAGKTTLGARLAARLGVPFLDSDRLLEEQSGLGVAELFRTRGEGAFRALERELLLELAPRPGQLLATGGGCVLDPEVRAGLRRHGHVVWLTAPLAVLAARVRAGAPRPSLTGADPADELAAVLAVREPLYRACAHTTLDTSRLAPDEVTDVLEQLWTLSPHHHVR